MGVIRIRIFDAILPLPLIPSREGRGERTLISSRRGDGLFTASSTTGTRISIERRFF